jgi:hypothetical protein
VVEGNDVAITAHGRSFYILDDVGPLRQYGREVTDATEAYLFKPGDAIRSGNPATITYWLKKPVQKMTLDILDGQGQVVRSYNGILPDTEGRGGASSGAGREGAGRSVAAAEGVDVERLPQDAAVAQAPPKPWRKAAVAAAGPPRRRRWPQAYNGSRGTCKRSRSSASPAWCSGARRRAGRPC